MKTTERHHLKENELANALGQAQHWAGGNAKMLLTAVGAIVRAEVVGTDGVDLVAREV